MKTSSIGLIAIGLVSLGMQGCNVLRGQSTPGEYVDDVALTAAVKSDLLSAKNVDGLDVNVDVKDGAVKLRGWASSPAERTRATAVARAVKGVRSVSNEIKIKE